MKTVYIQTDGCQMNVYDSTRTVDLLKQTHGLQVVDKPESADLLLLNTCSIRERAQEKVFSTLGRFRELKEERPEILIAVGGCVASQEGSTILKRAPFVDLVFGPQTLQRLPEMIDETRKTGKAIVDVSFPTIEKFDVLPTPEATGPSAYVSIMEGCSKFCSFCVVPYTRGPELSRPLDSVLHEIYTLGEQGVREITLLGQNVNAYQGQMHSGETADLALLISYVAEMDNILRIRFSTSHPLEFSERLIHAYADTPKLANHLHLPIQSGSDRILGMMKRGYTRKSYCDKIQKLRAVRPDISVTSDFIVGFPGETDEDFEATLNLVHDLDLDRSFCFIYSQRPGTPAANLHDNVSMHTKKERLKILQERLNQQTHQWSQRMLGQIYPVLITGPSSKDPTLCSAKTDNNRVVHFKTKTNLVPGTLVSVEITHALTHILSGQCVA
jgi:tRNA-2-methylthio-N6-dimethylallyladenosine synthase